jgi:hypothetical protein
MWKGVIKDNNGQIIWECCHVHHNREQSTNTNGKSAKDCAGLALLYENPEWREGKLAGRY